MNSRTGEQLRGNWRCTAVLVLVGLAGCDASRPTDQQVRQQAAQTTVAVKQEAKQAVAGTQKVAAEAERKVNDVAAGVKDGLETKPGGEAEASTELVDINSATLMQLAMLPGISFAKAGAIVKGRPYTTPRELVSKGILSRGEYDLVATKVTAKD